MRLVICTKRDLAGALILNNLLPRLSADHQVMVFLSDKTRTTEKQVHELGQMKFLERDLPMNILFPLIDQDEQAQGHLATFQGLDRQFKARTHLIEDINAPQTEAIIRDFAPDLILSARFSLIFKPHIYDIPPLGTWNVHPGALPRYAGLFAPFRCMLEGQDKIGCTLHRIDRGIDTGPVMGIGWLPIQPSRSMLWHVVRTYGPGLDLFMDMFQALARGDVPQPQEQDRSQRIYASLPDAQAFDTFRARGLRLWDQAEYLEILKPFSPPHLADRHQIAVAAALHKLGAPCCCGPA